MSRYILITTLILGGVILSGFYPIRLPVDMVNAMNELVGYLLSLEGIIPVLTILKALTFVIVFELAFTSYKVVKWIVG